MSFVLEALKKQEAGGDPDAAVSLARTTRQQRRQRVWMALFAVAMAGNAALLGWVFLGPETPSTGTERSATVTAAQPEPPGEEIAGREMAGREPAGEKPAGTESDATESAAPLASSQAPTASSSPAPTAEPSTPEEASPPAPAGPTQLALSELPPDARARFPGIAFSTHVYAEDTDLRAVVANGRRLTEGERVRGLEVVEITENGVVLAFERYLVEVPIVTDWDAL